jgi:ElaB/YqjD/DUF883 family membrane-anchored ribosome-binding protein
MAQVEVLFGDLSMSRDEAKEVVEIRSTAVAALEKLRVGMTDIEQAELDGMIEAINGMYNPYEYVEDNTWQ